jgi:hypothetical protein
MLVGFPNARNFQNKRIVDHLAGHFIGKHFDIAISQLFMDFIQRDFVFDVDFSENAFFNLPDMFNHVFVILDIEIAFVFVEILFNIDFMQGNEQIDAIQNKIRRRIQNTYEFAIIHDVVFDGIAEIQIIVLVLIYSFDNIHLI